MTRSPRPAVAGGPPSVTESAPGPAGWAAAGPVVAVIVFLWPIAATMSFFANWHAALFWLVLGWALAVTGGPRPAPATAGEAAR